MTISAGSAVTGTRWWKPECSGKWAGFLGDRKNGQQLSHVPRLTVIFMSWQGYRYYQTIDPNPAWPVLNLTLKKRQLLSLVYTVYTDRCHRLQSVGFRTTASSAIEKQRRLKRRNERNEMPVLLENSFEEVGKLDTILEFTVSNYSNIK